MFGNAVTQLTNAYFHCDVRHCVLSAKNHEIVGKIVRLNSRNTPMAH